MHISTVLPDFVTQDSLQVNITTASAKVIRLSLELSNKLFPLSEKVILFGKGMFFVSIIKLPNSIYNCTVKVLKINKTRTFQKKIKFSKKLAQKAGVVAKEVMDILKGMKAFGLITEKYLWLVKPTPLCNLISSIAICGKLYADIQNYKNNRNLAHQLALVSSTFDIGAIAILSLSPLTPLAIPAYSLLTLSAIASLAKTSLQ